MLPELLELLDDDIKCRTFLSKWLGNDAFNFIDEDIKRDLINAIKNYEKNPEQSIRYAGNALEDHLKLISKNRQIRLVNRNGRPLHTIGSIMKKLFDENVIADHHYSTLRGLEVFLSYNVLEGLNAFRKMTSHGKNLNVMKRWELGYEIALVIILQLILAIRSTYYYAVKNKLRY
jgi:hypothetical protein